MQELCPPPSVVDDWTTSVVSCKTKQNNPCTRQYTSKEASDVPDWSKTHAPVVSVSQESGLNTTDTSSNFRTLGNSAIPYLVGNSHTRISQDVASILSACIAILRITCG